MKSCGLIALDIDGTTAVPGYPITKEVVDYLHSLYKEKWTILFITGRTVHTSHPVLHCLPFPYFLAVQNGAIILEMPSQKIINRTYLNRNVFPALSEICEKEPSDFVIFAGFEDCDRCYYRPKYFSEHLLEYLQRRAHAFHEPWLEFVSFDDLDLDGFPSIKCFGRYESAARMAKEIEKMGLHVPLIRDPFDPNYYVVQATHGNCDKGKALLNLIDKISYEGKVIAAGDDLNDLSMMAVADVKVVMATAPAEMLSQADVIAPSAVENGIIVGLKQAIRHER